MMNPEAIATLNQYGQHSDRYLDRPHPWHDRAKLAALLRAMRNDGWHGRPILVCGQEALTGSHRLEAARRLDIIIPVYDIDDTGHINIPGDDGGYTCAICGTDCIIAALLDAQDDDDRLSALIADDTDPEAIALMRAECRQNAEEWS